MDPGKTTVYVLRVDTARRCFFLSWVHVWPTERFFFGLGGGGQGGPKIRSFSNDTFSSFGSTFAPAKRGA